MSSLIAGIDIGGTTTDVMVVADDESVAYATRATDSSSPEGIAATATTALRTALDRSGADVTDLSAIGVCSPGVVDPVAGTISNARNLGVNGAPFHLAHRLEDEFGVSVSLENDVTAAALALHHELAPEPPATLVYLNIGTGIAAAAIIDGMPLRGATGAAGELGQLHMAGGPETVEDIAGGRAIAAEDAGETGAGVGQNRLAAIADLIHAIFVAYDPNLVVIGGGVTAAEGFEPALREAVAALRSTSPVAARFTDPHRIQVAAPDSLLGPRGAIYIAGQNHQRETESPGHGPQAHRKETP